jgi:hypothetical protein
MALGKIIEPPSFDLDAKPLDSSHDDERPPPICDIGKCSTSCIVVSSICYGQPIRGWSYRRPKIASHIEEAQWAKGW